MTPQHVNPGLDATIDPTWHPDTLRERKKPMTEPQQHCGYERVVCRVFNPLSDSECCPASQCRSDTRTRPAPTLTENQKVSKEIREASELYRAGLKDGAAQAREDVLNELEEYCKQQWFEVETDEGETQGVILTGEILGKIDELRTTSTTRRQRYHDRAAAAEKRRHHPNRIDLRKWRRYDPVGITSDYSLDFF